MILQQLAWLAEHCGSSLGKHIVLVVLSDALPSACQIVAAWHEFAHSLSYVGVKRASVGCRISVTILVAKDNSANSTESKHIWCVYHSQIPSNCSFLQLSDWPKSLVYQRTTA